MNERAIRAHRAAPAAPSRTPRRALPHTSPRMRAVAARTCEKVNPPPCTVLVCEDAEPPAGANFNFNTIITNGNSDKVLDALVAAVEKYYPDRAPV